MARCIIAAAPGVDLYGEWSTVIDGFGLVGTRDELAAAGVAPERIARAAQLGTSMRDAPIGAWDDPGLHIVDGGATDGWLPRSRLPTYLAALHRDAQATADALLDPIPDPQETPAP